MQKDRVRIEVPRSTLLAWQEIVDLLAEMIAIPAALIMRLDDPDIEVFVSSGSQGNPYHPGDREQVWNSGLYCETVIKTQDTLLVPNALTDPDWRANPDVKLGMISYLGFPIALPDGNPFGTLCVLDGRENAYSAKVEKLMAKFRDLVQSDLEMIYVNRALGDQNRRLIDYLREIQALRGMVPICANCKSIKDAEGEWHPIEHYLIQHPEADFTHGICPTCRKKLYPEFEEASVPRSAPSAPRRRDAN
jgi:transcriptional regulator with GAF, ATPase, and Fis domain